MYCISRHGDSTIYFTLLFDLKEEERNALEEKLSLSQLSVKELQTSSSEEREKLFSKLELLTKELEKSAEENRSLNSDIDNLKVRIKDFNQNLEEKDLLINSLKESISSQGDSSDMEREIETLKAERNNEMKVKEEEIKQMMDILKEKEESHATYVQQLKSQISSIETEKSDLIASLEKAKHDKEMLNNDFEMFQKSNANFKEQMASVQELVTNMENEKEKVGVFLGFNENDIQ